MGNNEGTVADTLKQRGSVYGKYEDVCRTRDAVMSVLNSHHYIVNGEDMNPVDKIAIGDLVLKLVRGVGAPNYTDSWHDLAGYATLIEEMKNEANS
jgi:hypothetical protein